jgi:hypothetical protein
LSKSAISLVPLQIQLLPNPVAVSNFDRNRRWICGNAQLLGTWDIAFSMVFCVVLRNQHRERNQR